VRTRQGDFTGLIQWDSEESLGSDELTLRTAGGAAVLRFDTISSIERRAPRGGLVTLSDGSEIALTGDPTTRGTSRGIYVDDPRYGRVLIGWEAFERIDFRPGGTGPSYDDFAPGRPLTGSVLTRAGLRLTGRLVFDLDESETTETLDAPSQGVNYNLPVGLVASIALPGPAARDGQRVDVTLHTGEELQLEPTGDLGDGNAGLLVFAEGAQRPRYLVWADIERIDFDPLALP
jgi:hypothetical protein